MTITIRSTIEPLNNEKLLNFQFNDNGSLTVVIIKNEQCITYSYHKDEYESISIH